MSEINQKEYLKKYLSSDLTDEKKKKKKKKKLKAPINSRVKIIDDDVMETFTAAVKEDLANNEDEDAPQIVEVIDERPVDLRTDEFKDRSNWVSIKLEDESDVEEPPSGNNSEFIDSYEQKPVIPVQQSNNDDLSPPRPKRSRDISPPRRERRLSNGRDSSPPHKRQNSRDRRRSSDRSPPRRDRNRNPNRRNRWDASPPRQRSPARRQNRDSKSPHNQQRSPARQKNRDSGSPRQRGDSHRGRNVDLSPARRINRNSNSPHQRGDSRRGRKSDLSPARRTNRDSSSPRKREDPHRGRNADLSPSRRKSRDSSPPRPRGDLHRGRNADLSPARRPNRDSISPRPRGDSYRNRNVDLSPVRRKNRDSNSPRTRGDSHRGRNADLSPARRKNRDSSSSRRQERKSTATKRSHSPRGGRDLSRFSVSARNPSPPRGSPQTTPRRIDDSDSDRSASPSTNSKRMKQTLDGKKAGLQNAKDLDAELRAFKHREDAVFNQMSHEVSGANAKTIRRDKHTGRRRDLEAEAAMQEAKSKEQAEIKAKYDRWGKGVKQVEDVSQKIQEDLYEMSKPLARYANDEDLEKYLKEQEREGDPMLAYIRKKKHKEIVETGKPLKPRYEGEFMPNRFGIRPGHKWDGVDRSSGYEKRWFEVQNAKNATREESYKWSTEDM